MAEKNLINDTSERAPTLDELKTLKFVKMALKLNEFNISRQKIISAFISTVMATTKLCQWKEKIFNIFRFFDFEKFNNHTDEANELFNEFYLSIFLS